MHLYSRWRLSNNGNCFPIPVMVMSPAFAMASIIVMSWNKVLVPASYLSINSILKAR
jgi:hypothetical protein